MRIFRHQRTHDIQDRIVCIRSAENDFMLRSPKMKGRAKCFARIRLKPAHWPHEGDWKVQKKLPRRKIRA